MGIVEFLKGFRGGGGEGGNPKTLREAITLLNALGYDLDAHVESIKVNTLSAVTKRAVVTLKLRGVVAESFDEAGGADTGLCKCSRGRWLAVRLFSTW